MKIKGLALGISIALLIAACNTAGVKSYQSGVQVNVTTTQDKRIWMQADEFDQMLDNQGPIYRDDELTAYLNKLAVQLYPEFVNKIHINVLQHPSFNAFALPNGSIYIHTGLLAKLENEAELAIVLAHEVAHFVHRHSLKQTHNIKLLSTLSLGVTILTGIPFLSDIIAISSVYGFSRDLEREADREGYQRLVNYGYDAAQASHVFEKMLAEVKALEIDEPVFFSSHPKLQERIDSFKLLASKSPSTGILNEKDYKQKVNSLYPVNIKDELQHQQYKKVIYWLERSDSHYKRVLGADYYLGEAYALRNEDDDKQKALTQYKLCIKKNPDFAPSYRAVGKYYYQEKNYNEARTNFKIYLELEPDAKDRSYINQYLSKMDSQS